MKTLLSSSLAASLLAATGAYANTSEGEQAGEIDPKKVFAKNCAWCHSNYGLEAGKGPKLAGTALSEKGVYDRIFNGKSGAMPAYKKLLSDAEIRALTTYIKGLEVSTD